MIEREQKNIVFICDECGDRLETHTESLSAAQDTRRTNGWETLKDNETFKNLCSNCGGATHYANS